MIGVYKITSPTGRIYIGQSLDIKRRWKQHKKCDHKTSYTVKLFRSFLKYGVSNHIFEILEECSIDLLNDRERYWQEFYNSASVNNLNCFLVQTSSKRREGQIISDKQKAQISLVHKGKKYSAETRQKIKDARAKQIITIEHRKSISDNSGSARLVLNKETGIYYVSAKEAAEAHGIKPNTLVCYLLGKTDKIKKYSSLQYV